MLLLDKAPLSLLMGCSSVKMGMKGRWIRMETPLYYMILQSPATIGCLWDVSDGDLDRMTRFIIDTLVSSEKPVDLCELLEQAKEKCLLRSLVGSSLGYCSFG